MSPSSPVSVGILLSNRRLEVGTLHIEMESRSPMPMVTLEQCPVADDPFTGLVDPLRKKFSG